MNDRQMRMVAARLAALHPKDQRWLLRRLPRPVAVRLRTMIRQAWRLAGGHLEILAAIGQAEDTRPEGNETDSPEAWAETLASAPVAWARELLDAMPGTSRDAVLAACPPELRDAVREAEQGDLPPRLSQAIRRAGGLPPEAAESDGADTFLDRVRASRPEQPEQVV